MCYCDLSADEIRDDLERGTIPDAALTRGCLLGASLSGLGLVPGRDQQ